MNVNYTIKGRIPCDYDNYEEYNKKKDMLNAELNLLAVKYGLDLDEVQDE